MMTMKRMVLGVALGSSLLVAGCRPYDKPEYSEIDTSETGFLIPLEGDTSGQARFASEQYLQERKVAAKRVQIPHRWNQTGRLYGDGDWLPTVRLVKVNRSPITREWTAEGTSGSAAKNQAIWTESGDSVGFSMGFNCTAMINEDDAARFLYYYPSGSLEHVMDTEVRGRVQKVASEVAAQYRLDDLRGKKQQIIDAVSKDVVAFFAQRGITVTTVGMFGGMTYENPAIQKSIDDTFIAQQLKEIANSKMLAQEKENQRIELEAQATAERSRREAQGQADAKLTLAKAEAEGIREVNRALTEAAQSSGLLQLKALDVEKERVSRWNGQYPMYYLGGGAGNPGGAQGILLNVPAPVIAAAATTQPSAR